MRGLIPLYICTLTYEKFRIVLRMKILINSGNIQREWWYDLVKSEKGDSVHKNDGIRDWFEGTSAGTYYIQYQRNRSSAPVWHYKVSENLAQELLSLPVDGAVKMMAEIVAP